MQVEAKEMDPSKIEEGSVHIDHIDRSMQFEPYIDPNPPFQPSKNYLLFCSIFQKDLLR